ncbi:MAG: TonB-dependent siderophore receptor [Pseudomonadota bacterium]
MAGVSLVFLGTPNSAGAEETAQLETVIISSTDEDSGTAVDADAKATGPGNGYIAETTTTGSRIPTALRDIPRSVSVVTRQQLDDRRPQQLEDALGYTAGVIPSIWGVDDRFNQFMIRGFDVGSNSVYRDGLSQKVIDFSGFKIEPWSLERVEVLKGPSGVLYGENDAGGLVNAITKRPVFDTFVDGYLGYGSFNTIEAAFDAGTTLDQNKEWAVRLTGLFRDGATERDNSENDRKFIAPAITWQPTDQTNLTILANYQWDNLTPNLFLPVAGQNYSASLGDLPKSFRDDLHDYNKFDANHGSIGYLFTHEFNDNWTVRQNTRYSEQDTDYQHLYFGWMNSATDMQFVAFTVDETAKVFSSDNQIQHDFQLDALENTLLLGLDYNRYQVDGRNGFGSSPDYLINVQNPNYDFNVTDPAYYLDRVQTVSRLGLYAQNQSRILDDWLLTLGVRQSWVDNKTKNRLNGTSTSQNDTDTSYSAGLGYDFANGITPYASYSESFVTNIGSEFDGSNYEPSKGRQYEAGIKYQPTFFNGFFTIAVFDITKSNILTSDPAHAGFLVQTGEVNHRGVELEGNYDLGNGLSMTAAYSYVHAEITKNNDGNVGNRPERVPEHQASLWANYKVPSGTFEGFSLGAGVRYVGESYGDNANTIEIDSYTLVDAAVRYQRNKMELSLNATNLFDKEYFANCSSGAGCIEGEGRSLMGRLSIKF